MLDTHLQQVAWSAHKIVWTTSSETVSERGRFPEKRALLFLRSDLALQERILKTSTKSAENAFFLRSVLTVQDRIFKIRVFASLGCSCF